MAHGGAGPDPEVLAFPWNFPHKIKRERQGAGRSIGHAREQHFAQDEVMSIAPYFCTQK